MDTLFVHVGNELESGKGHPSSKVAYCSIFTFDLDISQTILIQGKK